MKNYKIKFNLKKIFKTIIYCIVFFSLLKPDSLEYIGLKWLDRLAVGIDGLLMVIMTLFVILKKYKLSKNTIIIFAIYCIIGVSTMVGTKDYFSLLKVGGTAIGIAMFTDYSMQKDPKTFFRAAIMTLITLFTINFITIIKYYPVGMYSLDYVTGDLYFMGHDNGMIYNLIPMCGLSFIYSYAKKGRFFSTISLISLILLFASVFYVKTATGIIESAIFVFLVLLVDNKLFTKLVNPKVLIILFYVLNILIVFIKIQNYFSWFFVGVLGKDLTFTGRTVLWENAMSLIKSNPILGYGIGFYISGTNGHMYNHAHCLLLDFIIKGGVISLLSFMYLLYSFSKKYSNSINLKMSKIILVVIITLLIGEITAACPYKIFFWSFLVLIQYTDRIQNSSMQKV